MIAWLEVKHDEGRLYAKYPARSCAFSGKRVAEHFISGSRLLNKRGANFSNNPHKEYEISKKKIEGKRPARLILMLLEKREFNSVLFSGACN